MRNLKSTFLYFLLFLFCICSYAQQLHFKEERDKITLYEGGSPRFSYQKGTKSKNGKFPRANYIHPLYDTRGDILTEDFPEDHLHHRGVFWTWHQLFVKGKRVSDPWLCEGIRWKVDSARTEVRKNSGILHTVVYWVTDSEEAVIREEASISYTPKEGYYLMDFDISLTALTDGVEIGGSEDDKGYGGFSARIKSSDGITFFSAQGEVTPENTPVKTGGWVHAIPDYDTGQKEQTGIVLFCDPENLPSFQGWILRKNQSMQNAAFPGRKPISIPREKPLKFRNRLVVHQGKLTIAKIQGIYRDFIR
ncbi:hypothetical protein ED312_17955 [Sinomicrobium pectinilyticum]|uniref:Methane oxygenase PmoA n=1 Tax=Sinomicrobium pectinilyticum TaxID=1084421 RepID=A0A3N0E268_SINP1|nr:DUF6807 family protein [Sinomicrobium pectinilyticum]RNL81915.1 hypothetical protein ED312_17955 [Sinomicrobium pectinilyticum]